MSKCPRCRAQGGLGTTGEPAPGAIDHPGDVDFFAFWAEQGRLYQIDVALGTLPDSILEPHDPEWFEMMYEDTDFDIAISGIQWQASYTGDHHVSVRGYEGYTGTYALTVAVE